MKAFERYRDFTDFAELVNSSSMPLRKSLRINTLKCTREELLRWGKTKSWSMSDVPWTPEGFFIDRQDRSEALGKDLLHVLGYTYMQEAASMLPVALLEPMPGEVILDMSAAPGSKTTQLASLMGNTGLLVANDIQEKRIWSLLSNLQRCGVTNTVVTKKVGQWFSRNMTERFDRVLCDAPCTAQGTVRKDSDALTYCSAENTGKMQRLQMELLESAIHACKVGGRVVYSTCTLTPEENEEVIISILNKFSDQIKPLDKGLYEKLGLTKAIENSHRVQRVHSSTDREVPMARLWPQTYDTEGFFACALQKVASTRAREDRDHEMYRYKILPNSRADSLKKSLTNWYGTPFALEGDLILEDEEKLQILSSDALRFPLPLKPYYIGLPFSKAVQDGFVRISHEAAVLRGSLATSQLMVLSPEQMADSFRGTNIQCEKTDIENGDILLALQTPLREKPIILGRGLLKNGVILNRLPREIVRMFS